jgi:hypothetical protein
MRKAPNSHAVKIALRDLAVGGGRTLCMSSFRVASEGIEGQEGGLGWIKVSLLYKDV